MIAHWIVDGDPDVDITGMNIDRLHPYQANPDYRRKRTVESLGSSTVPLSDDDADETARGAKQSAIHDRLAAPAPTSATCRGGRARTGTRPPGVAPKVEKLSWGRQNWFPWWAAEHRAAREGVILMDMSFMSKFRVEGRDAGRVLNHISANDVDGASGTITYTPWLNERGKLEADLTVTKLDEERFFVVVTDTMHRHAETWMRRHIPDDAHAFVTDVTSGYCQINVQGPRSRALLQSLTSADLSNAAFPYRTAREIEIGYTRRALHPHHLSR